MTSGNGNSVPEQPLKLDNPLWQFARDFWARPEAEQACLALQSKGWSVTRVLSACWLAASGCAYTGIEGSTVTDWRKHVTEALRSARTFIPKGCQGMDTLRARIAANELDAERMELALTYQALTPANAITGGRMELTTLAHRNLQAAAPEHAMDKQTGRWLDLLVEQLLTFTHGATRP